MAEGQDGDRRLLSPHLWALRRALCWQGMHFQPFPLTAAAFICPTSPQQVCESPNGTPCPALPPRGYRYNLSLSYGPSLLPHPAPPRGKICQRGNWDSAGGTSNPRAGHRAVSVVSAAHFHLQSQQNGDRLPGSPYAVGFTNLRGVRESDSSSPVPSLQPAQTRAATSSLQPPVLARGPPAPGQALHQRGPGSPPCSPPCLETRGHSVPFILSKNNSWKGQGPSSCGCQISSQPQLYSGKTKIKGPLPTRNRLLQKHYCYINNRDQLML